ncbi:hypothetical protein [Streptomyces cadmiisoli]|uniref:hypothetical protein n=1 Tax=Streptomyces cadmiisoli TaxID=2184053 RepID=UPI003D709266
MTDAKRPTGGDPADEPGRPGRRKDLTGRETARTEGAADGRRGAAPGGTESGAGGKSVTAAGGEARGTAQAPESAAAPVGRETSAAPVSPKSSGAPVAPESPPASAVPATPESPAPATPESPAAPATAAGPGARSAPARPAASSARTAPLLPHDETDKLAQRLQHAVAGFVDAPRAAVEEADQVLEEIAGRFTEAVARRRRTLRGSWQAAEEGATATADTEQLRLALRDYRELADRLLRH